ncbi:MAG: radical SAM protein [Deltaproteobacteria bacterium]|nr:radical SAM protein [Deltaproteobacteria bacterium]
MSNKNWHASYLRLHPKSALKNLEQPFVYHMGRDELYEIDERAQDFLLRCNGESRGKELTTDADFVEYCLEEGILEGHEQPVPATVTVNDGLTPSLRYLELHLLHKCNLNCRHCYLGPLQPIEMPVDHAIDITRQFSDIGGLRLLISGGEPLLYKDLKTYLEQTRALKIRRVLFTNGTLINSGNISWLDVDEIQFSLDGWKKGHEHLRGRGTFEPTLQGIHLATAAGIPVSISTMIHQYNLNEFERLRDFIEKIHAIEWGVDVMCVSGSLMKNPHLTVPYETAARYLKYGFGGGYHGSSEGFACGRHLMTVLPNRQAVKCGFYVDRSLGDAQKSLKHCWLNMNHVPLDQLECKGCSALEECRGGCRFRAPHPLAPDPAMCAFYGISR